jgi:hypothetical protein
MFGRKVDKKLPDLIGRAGGGASKNAALKLRVSSQGSFSTAFLSIAARRTRVFIVGARLIHFYSPGAFHAKAY